MELRGFAERIVYGATLAEKLAGEGAFTDVAPGAAFPVERPLRPPELAFPTARLRDDLPPLTRLDDAAARGGLLHRFANHELLALEIMASTLLRFPDAPAAFRMGIARTMVEEQRHLRLYLARMGQLGVALGDVPVNDFFWRCTETIASPYDYVLRMALTFEQANLDFTKLWRERFTTVGDLETAAVLDVVYHDEIGHVRAGLSLFRQWKDPARSEWEAFEAGLAMPLSPSRARGSHVDREGRLAAGFTDDWIDRIELYSRSRGRPPRVYAFNPACEEEVAFGRSGFALGGVAAALQRDLAPLMIFLAAKEDAVITPTLPSPGWQRAVVDAGFVLPEIVASADALASRLVGPLVPWGRSPSVGAAFGALAGADNLWVPGLERAFSKENSLAWRAEFLAQHPEPWLAPPEGEVCRTEAEVEAAAARGWLLKAPFSTAGRDRRRGPLDASARGWVARILKAQGALRAEPLRDRVLDLSFHFDVAEVSRFVGTVRFFTTPNGQFTGTAPGRWLATTEPEFARALSDEGRQPRRLRQLGEQLTAFLGPRLFDLGVRGPVGVDAFLYRDGSTLRLDPLVEVNPRFTMGRVSLALEARLHPHARARWRFFPVAKLGASLTDWYAAESAAKPLQMASGQLRRGVFATNDPATATTVLTVLELT
ncbi:hypothetical protein LBMAG42_55230 [Deltaproteobacteria bacterium]|nr:hypothetical protein LBMAG42_55230 [Deltaproteobacteria bacterium]